MQRPLGAQISQMLKDRGVTHIFGIPGVHNQELYRGIEEAGLTHILARHEQGAGFMADGYARATGRPGVAYVISGPGLTNIMTPIGQAYSDSVPMLVISSCLDETAATRGQLHQMKDQRAAAATVCDWSEEARTADAAYALIDRALTEFDTRRTRPKHLQVTIAALTAATAPPPPAPNDELAGSLPRDPLAVRRIADALRSAQRPILILGGGATVGASLYPKLADRAGAAILTSFAGRGIVPPGHPLLFGAGLARPDSADILDMADLVVTVGCELAEVDLWRPKLGSDTPMIRLDIDPAVLATHRRAQDRIVLGDAYEIMEAVLDALDGDTPAGGWDPAFVTATRVRWRSQIEAERPGLLPVIDALRESLPEGTMIYSDMTQFAYAALEVWDMDRPGHWHHPSGFGTLGYALPAAIGGAVARPGKPTLAIAGDYGFQYTMQELATAVELSLPLPIVLWDNDGLGEIADSMTAAQIAPNAVTARNPDFLKLAEAYGARAAQPADLAELPHIIRAAFAAPVPTLIRLRPGLS